MQELSALKPDCCLKDVETALQMNLSDILLKTGKRENGLWFFTH